ncbi:hypothetical protein PCS70012_02349, partial [Streptococcus pneumoniae PCS70012]
DLGHQLGIGGELEDARPPRGHPILLPDIGHGVVVDTQPPREHVRGPGATLNFFGGTLSVAVTFARWSIRRGRPDRSWSASPAISAYP